MALLTRAPVGLQLTWSGRCPAHTIPSADFCRPVGSDRSSPSPGLRTDGRSPEVSSTTFSAQPPDLQPTPLMDLDFVVICRLVRRRMPRIRFLSIGSRLCSTLPSDPASRRRPCVLLGLHLHQVVEKGTVTLKLSNMLGTPRNRDRGKPRGSTPPTPPYIRVRIRRFDRLSYFRTWSRGNPSAAK